MRCVRQGLLGAVAVVCACAPAPAPSPTITPASAAAAVPAAGVAPSPAISPVPSPSPQVDPQAQRPVEAAVRDLATRLNVPQAQVQVVEVHARDWSDSSLGCPQPGTMYAQVITPGYFVVLAATGRRFEYHTDRAMRAVLCREG